MLRLEGAAAHGREGRLGKLLRYARGATVLLAPFVLGLAGWGAVEHAITQRQKRADIHACRVRFERALALREKLKYGVTVKDWKDGL